MDEPTAALGVKEGRMVLELIRRVRDQGLAVMTGARRADDLPPEVLAH